MNNTQNCFLKGQCGQMPLMCVCCASFPDLSNIIFSCYKITNMYVILSTCVPTMDQYFVFVSIM